MMGANSAPPSGIKTSFRGICQTDSSDDGSVSPPKVSLPIVFQPVKELTAQGGKKKGDR
jgi:hypothetical protein